MTAEETQRSARETLSKIAEELQARRDDIAMKSQGEGAAALENAGALKPSIEAMIQAAVEALAPGVEAPTRTVWEPPKPKVEIPAKPPAETPIVSQQGEPTIEAKTRVAAEALAPAIVTPQAADEPPQPEPSVEVAAGAGETLTQRVDWVAGHETTKPDTDASHSFVVTSLTADHEPAVQAAIAAAETHLEPPASRANDNSNEGDSATEHHAAPAFETSALAAQPRSSKKADEQPAAQSATIIASARRAVARGIDNPQARSVALTYFPILIAILALVSSIYQGYLFHKSLDIMQRNVSRGEYIRTCRDIIETYFVVKQKISVLMPAADRSNVAGASRVTEANRIDAQAAVARFGALGTYLANFQDPGTRARYTELTRALGANIETAKTTPLSDIDKLFDPADKLFARMNDDCIRVSRVLGT